jgi:hypothetical protein
MSNLSDKDIDRLSREAADLYEPDHSNLFWSRLEQRLTEQMPGRPPDGFRFGRINPYAWGPAVILIAGLSFYFIKNTDYSRHSTRTDQGQIIKQENSKSATASASSGSVRLSNNAATAGESNKSLSGEENSTGGYPRSSGSESRNTHKSSGSGHFSGAKNVASKATHIQSDKYPDANDKSYASNDSQNSNNIFSRSATNNNASVSRLASPHTMPSIIITGAGPGKIKGNDSLLNRLGDLKTSSAHKSLRLNRSLNFGLTFGPDYTNGGGIANNQFSNNIGIILGYYLTNKLSVNAGILYSNKFFWAPGGKANNGQGGGSTQGFANNYAALPNIRYINGEANLYELPFTLRYDYAQNEKTKFFANAGLSSYFIIKQTSIYFSDRTPLALERIDDSQMNYWFNVANLSLGFETDMGKGFSFQVEPFVKLPLKNMGIENVKLNSYGIMFSFRFAPVLSRTKR